MCTEYGNQNSFGTDPKDPGQQSYPEYAQHTEPQGGETAAGDLYGEGQNASSLYGQSLYPMVYPGQTGPNFAYGSTPNQPADPGAPQNTARKRNKSRLPQVVAVVAVCLILSMAAGGASGWVVASSLGAGDSPGMISGEAESAAVSSNNTGVVKTTAQTGDAGGSVIASVAQKSAGSVVEISTETVDKSFFAGEYVAEGAGSGVVITSDGYIATNYHVINGASNVMVRTQDGTEYAAKLVGTDSKTDLAVIKVEASGLQPVEFADSDSIEVGDLAVAIGNPLGQLGGTVTDGIISAKDRDITIGGQTMTLLQTSAAVNPGNSGGGLFDSNGNLIGIVNAKSSGSDIEGLAFAIPSNTVKEVVNEIIDNGYVSGRPQLGISVLEITDQQTAFTYRVNGPGVYVASTTVDNGLKTGDRILRVAGEEINSSGDIADVLSGHAVGDTLKVEVQRDGGEISVDVTLTERVPEQ